MPDRNIVGPRVRQARLEHNPPLTQAELAARLQTQGLNIDRVAVSKIEIRYREVTDHELLALSGALDVSAEWLLFESP